MEMKKREFACLAVDRNGKENRKTRAAFGGGCVWARAGGKLYLSNADAVLVFVQVIRDPASGRDGLT